MKQLDRDRLRAALESDGRSMRAVSIAAGLGETALRDILARPDLRPGADTLTAIAGQLGVAVSGLLGADEDGEVLVAHVATDDPRIVPRFLPVRYKVQAGHWIEVDEQSQDWEGPENPVVPDRRYSNYAQWLERVVGDSINLRIAEGSFAHVVDAIEMSYSPRRGDLVVVERRRQGGFLRERTIKEVGIEPSGLVRLWPRSTNPKWSEPMVITDCVGDRDDIEVQIVGLVLGSYASHV